MTNFISRDAMSSDVEPRDLTDQERKAIASLQRLGKRWPRTLRLASLDGSLVVQDLRHPGVHSLDAAEREAAVVADIHGIPNDGGAY